MTTGQVRLPEVFDLSQATYDLLASRQENHGLVPRLPICGVSVGPGWAPIIETAALALLDVLDVASGITWNGRIDQIKEKFGGLCIYLNTYPPEIRESLYQVERDACLDASGTCENCGSHTNVSIAGRYWQKNYCQECREGRYPIRKEN